MLKRKRLSAVGVIAVLDEATALEPFDAFTELAAHAEPRRQHGVEAIRKRRPRRWLRLCGAVRVRWPVLAVERWLSAAARWRPAAARLR